MLDLADIYGLDDVSTEPQHWGVPQEKRQRRKIVAAALGGWLQYLRKLTPYTQEGAAERIGISAEGVKRVERGENVGIEFLLPVLSWLEEELAVTQPKRHQEFRDGLFERLIEAGTEMRRVEPKGDPQPQRLPRAAVGERQKAARRTHPTR